MSVVLVTGGTGFLGAQLCRDLAARGDEVHVLARATSDRSPLARTGVVWHAGDLSDAASIERAAQAVATRARATHARALVVHCAALISYRTADGEAQREANVRGTERVLAAALAAGCERMLHVSSVVAVGRASSASETIDESAVWNLGPVGCDYATTKHEAEQRVLAARERLDVVVVNPGAIFGAVGRNSNSARFIRRMAQGRGPLVAPPGSISVLGVEDCSRGALAALDRGARGERYVLVDAAMSSLELFRAIARAVGARPPLASVPRLAWPAIVAGARVVDRVRPIDLTPPQALAMLGSHMRLSGARARRELDWRPEPFEDVLERTVASLSDRGLLDEPA